jgi:hypothetical protein
MHGAFLKKDEKKDQGLKTPSPDPCTIALK